MLGKEVVLHELIETTSLIQNCLLKRGVSCGMLEVIIPKKLQLPIHKMLHEGQVGMMQVKAESTCIELCLVGRYQHTQT